MYKEIVFEKRHMSKREMKMVWIFFILINSLNIKKNMLNAYFLMIIYITILNGMAFPEANSQKLDYLFSKLLGYEHYAENYKVA